MLTNIHMFATALVALLILFHEHVHAYIDLLFLTFVTMISGLYISLINPRKYVFTLFNNSYELSGADRFFVVDIFFHVGIFMFVYSVYKNDYTPLSVNCRFLFVLLLFVSYIILIDTKKLYGVQKYELTAVCVVSILVYMMLFDKK